MICWRRTAFSARRAARERKAERSAARTVLKISMNIGARDLARGDHPRNPAKLDSGSTWHRIFAANRDFDGFARAVRRLFTTFAGFRTRPACEHARKLQPQCDGAPMSDASARKATSSAREH
jgi:hypothetical protein